MVLYASCTCLFPKQPIIGFHRSYFQSPCCFTVFGYSHLDHAVVVERLESCMSARGSDLCPAADAPADVCRTGHWTRYRSSGLSRNRDLGWCGIFHRPEKVVQERLLSGLFPQTIFCHESKNAWAILFLRGTLATSMSWIHEGFNFKASHTSTKMQGL